MLTWDGIRGTLQWAVVLALLGALVGGATAARWWADKDALLTYTIQGKLEELFPTCDTELESIRVLDGSHLEATQLRLRSRATHEELLRVPRLTIELDGDILQRYHRVMVREVIVHGPEILLVRDAHAQWNWAGFRFPQTSDEGSPQWVIRNAVVRLGFQMQPAAEPRFVACQGIQLTFTPQSHRRYEISGEGMADSLGALKVTGLLDSNTGEWSVQGDAGEIRVGDALLELAGNLHPPLQTHLTALHQTGARWLPHAGGRMPIKTADLGNSTVFNVSPAPAEALLRADLALKFRLGQSAPNAAVDYAFAGRIAHGQISDALLGRPLNDVQGSFDIQPGLVRIDQLRAANGPSQLFLDGIASLAPEGWEREFVVRATQLPLSEEVRAFLPAQLVKQYDMLRPSGTFDLDIGLKQPAGDKIAWTVRKFQAVNCRILCDYFRYPVDRIQGEVTQQGSAFYLRMNGYAGDRPVSASGILDPLNTDVSVDLRIEAADIPIDTSTIAAIQRDDQREARRALEALNLRGTAAAANVHIFRGAVTNNAVACTLKVDVRQANVNFNQFPYPVSNVSGTISYDPSRKRAWVFDKLRGVHGGTQLAGKAVFDLTNKPGKLDIRLSCLQVPLDHELKHACVTANAALASVWSNFDPSGQLDVDEIRISWQPGNSPKVGLQGIRVVNGRFVPVALPFAWSNVNGVLHWEESELKIHSLHGEHGDTYMRIDGSRPGAPCVVQIAPDAESNWQMHLADLQLVKVNPDEELKRALPRNIVDALDSLDFRGPLDLAFQDLHMTGWKIAENAVTAAWKIRPARLRGNSISAGLPVTNISGNLAVERGSWDGSHLVMDGYLEVDSARAIQMTFRDVRGPFLLSNNRLTVGTPQRVRPAPVQHATNPYREKTLSSQLYGGRVGLNADVDLQQGAPNVTYDLDITASDLLLAQWAADWGINSQHLAGKVNAELRASGRGQAAMNTIGDGWLQIAPAALMELPVFAQLLTALSFRPAQPGEAAFNYAYADFLIRNGEFDFPRIELIGDAIGLGGVGHIGFAGPRANLVDLNFYTKNVNRAGPLKPVVDLISNNWINVRVTGDLQSNDPRNRVNAVIQPSIKTWADPFPGFMQAIQPGRQAPPRGR